MTNRKVPGLLGAPDRLPLLLMGILLATLWLSGGSSRPEVPSQLFVRVVSVVLGAVAAYALSSQQVGKVRIPLIFVVTFAAFQLVQLIPLPFDWWTSVPGRAKLASTLREAAIEPSWRPISLAPDMTLNALAALLAPIAAILMMAAIPRSRYRIVVLMILALGLTSGLLGLIQIATGASSLYFYRITNVGAAVGIFANRNHEAVLLAATFPFMAAAISERRFSAATGGQFVVAGGIALLIMILVIVTGSRGGLIAAVFGAVGGFLILSGRKAAPSTSGAPKFSKPAAIVMAAGALGAVVVTLVAARAEALQRLFSEDVSQELRLRLFFPLVDMGWKYFPFGSGFGSFVDIFKVHERHSDLGLAYLNHAHNDLLEFLIEGGVFALVLVAAFAVWWVRRGWSVWSTSSDGAMQPYARAASIVIGILLLASLSDYPLRTPTLGVLFAICVCILEVGGDRATSRQSRNSPSIGQ